MSAAEIQFSDLVDLVDCPRCAAGSKSPCGTNTGNVALQPHSARIRAASRALNRLCGDMRPATFGGAK